MQKSLAKYAQERRKALFDLEVWTALTELQRAQNGLPYDRYQIATEVRDRLRAVLAANIENHLVNTSIDDRTFDDKPSWSLFCTWQGDGVDIVVTTISIPRGALVQKGLFISD